MKKKGVFTLTVALAVSLMLAGGAIAAQTQYCKDLDGDGYGDPTDCETEWEELYVENDGDCNDNDENINPGELEDCTDTIDNNCINGINEGCDGGNKQYYYHDVDGDGYGDPNDFEFVTSPSPNYIDRAGDCNDDPLTGPLINPDATEICSLTDLTDENCNTIANEGCLTWWEDKDGDAYAFNDITIYDAIAPTGYVIEASLVSTTVWDCNDDPLNGGASINPGAQEIGGDQIDQNCDGDNGPYFPDPIMEACVLDQTGSYDPEVLANVSVLSCESYNVSDLSGIEYLTGLTNLTIWYSTVTDITPLSDLSTLTKLWVGYSSVSDLTPLSDLTGLTNLNLNGNSISDLTPLTNLTNLTRLSIAQNSISDISALANLTNLTLIELYSNYVSDLTPLSNLTNLRALYMSTNSVVDASPLANIPGLFQLTLALNPIDPTTLSNITSLTRLNVSSSNVTDLNFIVNLTGLTYLNIGRNWVISDLTPLSNLTNLVELFAPSNSISDLTPLADLANLYRLLIHDNCITDFSPVAHVTRLEGAESQGTCN